MNEILHLTSYIFHYTKIFTMNCQDTAQKYKKVQTNKDFKQIYSYILYLKRCKQFFKLQRKSIERLHTADKKPIQLFCQLNTSNAY